MYLITGATGHIGRPLVEQLHAGGHGVRAFVRDPSRADLLPKGIEIAVGDLDDRDSIAAALRGVESVFVLHVGAGTNQTQNVIDAAKAIGVNRVVLLSSVGVRMLPLAGPMPQMLTAREDLLRASGLAWTFLRPQTLMTNTLAWTEGIHKKGQVVDATDPGYAVPVDPADIARVAARVLTEDGHVGHAYILGGPEALTARQQVAILSDVLGRPIEFVVITPEQAEKAAIERGTPPQVARAIRSLNEMFRSRPVGVLTDDIENVTGVAGATFRDWCERHADEFEAGQPARSGH